MYSPISQIVEGTKSITLLVLYSPQEVLVQAEIQLCFEITQMVVINKLTAFTEYINTTLYFNEQGLSRGKQFRK